MNNCIVFINTRNYCVGFNRGSYQQTYRASVLLSCWALKNRWQKRFLLADENKSRATASAEETTSKLRASSDFGSRTFIGTFSSTIIDRISSDILFNLSLDKKTKLNSC